VRSCLYLRHVIEHGGARRSSRGMAMLMVLVFISISLLALTAGYERLLQVARSESVTDRVADGGDGTAEALGMAIARLQTGVPPESGYTCQVRLLSSDGRTPLRYDLVHTKVALDRWTVRADPGDGSGTDCPSVFSSECALVFP
jgi:hypothetical protein